MMRTFSWSAAWRLMAAKTRPERRMERMVEQLLSIMPVLGKNEHRYGSVIHLDPWLRSRPQCVAPS
jgi:hypothetical protein